ncbi:SWIB/MDM2 domain-containing protein [Powellomyces hirtus]|nr:SWIB/MDM2 domain-containing protein [Powellomyces hirtus]
MAAQIAGGQFDVRIREILSKADLSVVSAKAIRRQLTSETGQDLDPYKKEIDARIIHLLTVQEDCTAGDEDLARQLQSMEDGVGRASRSGGGRRAKAKSTTKRKAPASGTPRTNGLNAPLMVSPALSAFLGGVEEMSRPEVVKAIWAYVRENDLQYPADKRYIVVDEKLKGIFGSRQRVHMFTMNKLLTKHLIKSEDMVGGKSFGDADEIDDSDSDSVAEPSPKKKKPAKKQKRSGGGGTSENNALTKLNHLSPALSAVLGVSRLGRAQVVKQLWDYIKAKDLQNPNDRREIICDDALKGIFKCNKIGMFQMNKVPLKEHVLPCFVGNLPLVLTCFPILIETERPSEQD